jgi:flagellar hook-basal body complex protein FliE
MISINPNVKSVYSNQGINSNLLSKLNNNENKADFSETVKQIGNQIDKVDENQQSADSSIKDLLSGKNEDVLNVVSEVAKADMSFKLLVGVRNKLVEAYKQTMNMPI